LTIQYPISPLDILHDAFNVSNLSTLHGKEGLVYLVCHGSEVHDEKDEPAHFRAAEERPELEDSLISYSKCSRSA
jgi:hypothetical protein